MLENSRDSYRLGRKTYRRMYDAKPQSKIFKSSSNRKYRANNAESIRAGQKLEYEKRKERMKSDPSFAQKELTSRTAASLKRYYGLSLEEYNDMLLRCDSRCEICKSPNMENKKRLSVDHDHRCCPGNTSCGKCVRGLLCQRCNATIGMAGDSIEGLFSAIRYIEKYQKDFKRG